MVESHPAYRAGSTYPQKILKRSTLRQSIDNQPIIKIENTIATLTLELPAQTLKAGFILIDRAYHEVNVVPLFGS